MHSLHITRIYLEWLIFCILGPGNERSRNTYPLFVVKKSFRLSSVCFVEESFPRDSAVVNSETGNQAFVLHVHLSHSLVKDKLAQIHILVEIGFRLQKDESIWDERLYESHTLSSLLVVSKWQNNNALIFTLSSQRGSCGADNSPLRYGPQLLVLDEFVLLELVVKSIYTKLISNLLVAKHHWI